MHANSLLLWDTNGPELNTLGTIFIEILSFTATIFPSNQRVFYEAPTKKELWSILNEQCSENCQFISIPHNSNLSNGQMFLREEDLSVDEQLVFEPVIEIFQHKGSSECHPVSDTFCNLSNCPIRILFLRPIKIYHLLMTFLH